ncbi:MAG: hypothetical protein ACPIB2_03975 [Flavobacteriaceae bacterium]
MRNSLFFLFVSALIFTSCNQTESGPTAEQKMIFKQQLEIFEVYKKSHEEEDIEMFKNILSDSLQWSPPNFDGKILGKTDILTALEEVYFPLFDNIKFNEGVGLPYDNPPAYWGGSSFSSNEELAYSNNPLSLRVYGVWTANHTASGTPVQFKWFALIDFNEDGKIVKMSDYMDVSGTLMKLMQ